MSNQRSPVTSTNIDNFNKLTASKKEDLLVTEEPLEIRVKVNNGGGYIEKRLAVTMRTPGHDFELATGFLLSEGIIERGSDIVRIFYCPDVQSKEEEGNVLVVVLREDLIVDDKIFNRNFYVSSSCGVCGKSSIDSVFNSCSPKWKEDSPKLSPSLIHDIPNRAVSDQGVFRHTGGLHAAALFDVEGKLIVLREDIGRHNALDKVIGARLALEEKNDQTILFVSGRAGFELVQKSVVAGIPFMIAVGAPSSLSVELAKESGMTLLGFTRNNKFNVYSGSQRIIV